MYYIEPKSGHIFFFETHNNCVRALRKNSMKMLSFTTITFEVLTKNQSM